MMKKLLLFICVAVFLMVFGVVELNAQTPSAVIKRTVIKKVSPTVTPTAEPTPPPTAIPTPIVRADLTQTTTQTVEPLRNLLDQQKLSPVWIFNPLKRAIRASVAAGVPINTLLLLLLLPGVAAIIAAARHLIGIRGFGIFLPAALSVAFVAIGPVLGILLFLIIVFMSTLMRVLLRRYKIKLQYLPRTSLMLLLVVIGVLGLLFLAPVARFSDIINVSIFPVLIIVLLAEDFTKVQLGKSAKTAIDLAIETLLLSLISYIFLILAPVRKIVLLNPEIYMLVVFIFDVFMGKYIGLRLAEYIRFRKLFGD